MGMRRNVGWASALCFPLWILFVSLAMAQDEPTNGSSLLEGTENTAKKVGSKIGEGFTKAANKLEKKDVGEKIERKLKKAVKKTTEGFKKAADKIDKKLNH